MLYTAPYQPKGTLIANPDGSYPGAADRPRFANGRFKPLARHGTGATPTNKKQNPKDKNPQWVSMAEHHAKHGQHHGKNAHTPARKRKNPPDLADMDFGELAVGAGGSIVAIVLVQAALDRMMPTLAKTAGESYPAIAPGLAGGGAYLIYRRAKGFWKGAAKYMVIACAYQVVKELAGKQIEDGINNMLPKPTTTDGTGKTTTTTTALTTTDPGKTSGMMLAFQRQQNRMAQSRGLPAPRGNTSGVWMNVHAQGDTRGAFPAGRSLYGAHAAMR